MLGLGEDGTARKQLELQLRRSEQMLKDIRENVSAYIYLKDTEGRYLFANRMVRELWNADMADIVGRDNSAFFDAEAVETIRRNDRRVLVDGETVRGEEVNTVSATGQTAVYWSVKLPLRREDGSIYALCGISTDVTALKQHEKQLETIAHYDALTGVPNRVLLADRMQHALAQCRRVGAEALIRWRHPERGLLPPGAFLRAIEETELDLELGEWVIARGLAQLRIWLQLGRDVELSERERLRPPSSGTGYSSLTYLSKLPVDTLKIDQSFVRDMLDDPGNHAIVQGIIALSRTFGRTVVAKGIETLEQRAALMERGCGVGQRYFIARPMAIADFDAWRSRQPR